MWVNNTFKYIRAHTRAKFLRATFLVTAKEIILLSKEQLVVKVI